MSEEARGFDRNAFGYADRMTIQIAVKLADSTIRDIDRLVEDGTFTSRSDAVRAGLALVVSQDRERAIDHAFAQGFKCLPDTDRELATAHNLATTAIDEEPWQQWW